MVDAEEHGHDPDGTNLSGLVARTASCPTRSSLTTPRGGFVNEASQLPRRLRRRSEQPGGGWALNLPACGCSTRQAVEKYILFSGKLPAGDPPAWLTVADSIDELATKLGLDPAALVATIERFNGFARDGTDPDFHRGASGWDQGVGGPKEQAQPVARSADTAPFYAVEVISGALATKGGLRVNASGQVLSRRANPPIPGLYAAGNCSDAGAPVSYPGPGATIGEAMTFGYIIASHVAGSPAVGDRAAAQSAA